MLLLLPLTYSLPTLAEDNFAEAVVNPDAGQTPVTPGSGNELPQTPDSNSNNGNSGTPAANPGQPEIPATPEEAVIDPEIPGIPPAKDVIPFSVKKAPPMMSPGPGDVVINNTNFPDENFRKFLSDSKIDENQDHSLNQDELSKIGTLFLHIPGPIEDLRGLEYLTFLEYLIGHPTGKLDKIDVSPLPNLKEVNVGGGVLRELTFGNNPVLDWVLCQDNKLTSLDLHTLNNLLTCSCYNNQLTNLTLGEHPGFVSLDCHNNKLSSLSLNQCENLIELICNDNQLTALDVSNNLKLKEILVSNNHLTSLDLSKNPELLAQYFEGEHQTYSIEVDQDTLEFDLSSLPGNFIPARARKWVGASVSGMTLNLDPSMPATVTYNYDADPDREGFIMDVTLFVTYVSRNILIPCPYGAVICPTQPAYQTIPLTPVPVQQVPVDNIQGQVAQLPKTGEQESRAIAISSLMLLSLGAFFMISRRK